MRTDPGLDARTSDADATRDDAGDDTGDDTGGLGTTFAGLDALDLGGSDGESRLRRVWSATWPKLAAIAIAIFLWQVVVWSGKWESYQLAPPADAFRELKTMLTDGTLTKAIQITMRRAAVGFGLAVIIGVALGSVVSRVKIVRTAIGSLITGIMTMPSIAWFPLAILLFQISEKAILFVTVLGAAPAIANGLIAGVDHIPPILLRAGRVLGAKGWSNYRHIVLPASMPSFIGGLKQGWAFAWRSLMAGELLVIIPGAPSVGYLLQLNRELASSAGLLATMIVILVIGIVVDTLVFGVLDRKVRRRWGLVDAADR